VSRCQMRDELPTWHLRESNPGIILAEIRRPSSHRTKMQFTFMRTSLGQEAVMSSFCTITSLAEEQTQYQIQTVSAGTVDLHICYMRVALAREEAPRRKSP
jgi:hypothetical protein